MTNVYNYVAQKDATHLHGQRAINLRNGHMANVNEQLRSLRERARFSVRDVATFLEYSTHSRYSYYESKRFNGPLPLPLARKLAGMFSERNIDPEDVLSLAGLQGDEIKREAELSQEFIRRAPATVMLAVQMPSEMSLTRMFSAMLASAGVKDQSGEIARTLGMLLPSALAKTPADPLRGHRFLDDVLLDDDDFLPARAKESPGSQPE